MDWSVAWLMDGIEGGCVDATGHLTEAFWIAVAAAGLVLGCVARSLVVGLWPPRTVRAYLDFNRGRLVRARLVTVRSSGDFQVNCTSELPLPEALTPARPVFRARLAGLQLPPVDTATRYSESSSEIEWIDSLQDNSDLGNKLHCSSQQAQRGPREGQVGNERSGLLLSFLAANRDVIISPVGIDSAQRLQVLMWAGNTNINKELLKMGCLPLDRTEDACYGGLQRELCWAEQFARLNKNGMWEQRGIPPVRTKKLKQAGRADMAVLN